MEPFWDLKIGIYVEYLTHVSSKYITSWVLLSLTGTTSQTSRVLLADIIPWINKASLVLYIARMLNAMPRPTWCSEAVQCCRVHLLWLKLVIVEVESRLVSDSNLCDWGAGIDVACRLCTHYIDDLLPYAPLELCSYRGCGQVLHT